MVEEGQRVELLGELGEGVVLDAHVALFGNDFEFASNFRRIEQQVLQPVRFHRHDGWQMLAGDGGIKQREILGSEGVLRSAEAGDGMVVHTLGVVFRAGEHDMFHVMGEAGFAVRIVATARFNKQQLGDGGDAVVRHDDDG